MGQFLLQGGVSLYAWIVSFVASRRSIPSKLVMASVLLDVAMYVNQISNANSLKSTELNGGPLPNWTVMGIP